MSLAKMFLPELEHEMATTRKCIERFKDDQLGFKPHAKSMSVAQLISHLAEIPSWTGATFHMDQLDLSPPGGPAYAPTIFATVAETLATFDKGVAEAKAVLTATGDSSFGEDWSMLWEGNVLFTMSRAAVLRTWILNHLIHHRGQLSVYLRLLDIPVPSIYGPSADEGNM